MYALNFLFQYKSIGIGFKMEWDGVMRRGTGAMDETDTKLTYLSPVVLV